MKTCKRVIITLSDSKLSCPYCMQSRAIGILWDSKTLRWSHCNLHNRETDVWCWDQLIRLTHVYAFSPPKAHAIHIMYRWGLKAGIHPLSFLMGGEQGMGSAMYGPSQALFMLMLPFPPSLSFLPISSFSPFLKFLTILPHEPFLLLHPFSPTALVLLLLFFPFQMSQVDSLSSWHVLRCSNSAHLCRCVSGSLRCMAVLTKCQRRSSASTRTQPALKAAAGHLSITSTLSQITGSDV